MAKFRLPASLKSLTQLAPQGWQLGRGWVHPALWASIGLHLLVLLLPLPDRSRLQSAAEAPSDQPAETQVRVTPLPASPQPSVATTPPAPPAPSAVPLRPSPPVVSALPQPLPPRQIAPQRVAVPPPQTPRPVAPAVSPSPTTPASPTPPAVPPPALPFADLPLLAGAQTGCFGLGACSEITDGTPFRTAGQTLETQLTAQGYTVTPREDYDEAGRKVYQLTRGDEVRYLNVLSADVGSTVYLVTPQPISLDDLKTSTTIQAELTSLLDQTPSAPAAPAQFFQPDAFWLGGVARPETGGSLRFVSGSQPDQLLSRFRTALQAQNFNLTEAGGYGSGWLYEITKGPYTGYLNLVPAADQTGTIVVLWSQLPD